MSVSFDKHKTNKIIEGSTLMKESKTERKDLQPQSPWSVLEELARKGAREMLANAMELEVKEFVEKHKDKIGGDGRRLVVRNGYMDERKITTGIGPVGIKQPRIDDRKLPELGEERFSSKILPRHMRRVPSVNNLIPVLYLKGVSTGDFSEALETILGKDTAGLSATNIVRMKAGWEQEYQGWCRRDLSEKRYAYFWADGIHVNVRLDEERSCILVIMGADKAGNKELVAVSDGYRESKTSWREIMLDLKRRGLEEGPKLAIGDGALGFWAALREVFPSPVTKEQRCWFHKSGNILDKLPKSVQSKATAMIREMWQAPTKEDALSAFTLFVNAWRDKYPKAVECLQKDKDVLFTFYDFPAAHWAHIRTTNPIESTYATVRHRTKRTKGCGSRTATLAMVWKLAMEAQKSWRRLMGYQHITLVMEGRRFVDGALKEVA
jgi:transposase-like protein